MEGRKKLHRARVLNSPPPHPFQDHHDLYMRVWLFLSPVPSLFSRFTRYIFCIVVSAVDSDSNCLCPMTSLAPPFNLTLRCVHPYTPFPAGGSSSPTHPRRTTPTVWNLLCSPGGAHDGLSTLYIIHSSISFQLRPIFHSSAVVGGTPTGLPLSKCQSVIHLFVANG